MSLERHFWAQVDKAGPMVAGRPELGPCWIWTRGATKGYGAVQVEDKKWYAHRYAWTLLRGPIPTGAVLDHFVCFRPLCVNPEHLRPVTHRQNLENRAGLNSNNASGVRGVHWDRERKKWMVTVKVAGRSRFGGRFDDKPEAEQAAIRLRTEMMSHNLRDRA